MQKQEVVGDVVKALSLCLRSQKGFSLDMFTYCRKKRGFSLSLLSSCENSMVNLISHFNCITLNCFSLLRNPIIPRIKINEKCQFDYLHCCNCLSSKKLFQSKKSSSMIKVLCNQLKFEILMIQDVCHCSNFVK